MTNVPHYSPREAYAAYMLGSVLVDVRDRDAVARKSVDVGRLVVAPFDELDQHLDELPSDRTVVLVSRLGNTGLEAAKRLLEKGYDNIAIVEGGLSAWEEEGLPVRESA